MAGPEPRAWPFLVARGRDRGYGTLLAPGFLIAERGHGILSESAEPSLQEDRASVTGVVTGAGRALTLVHATHVVTAADLTEGTEPRDRHSRPLQLIYGFVCVDAKVSEADPADLAACRETALGVYRRFLGDEEGFTVEAGQEFVPRTHLTSPTPAPARRTPAPTRPEPAPARRPEPSRRPEPTRGPEPSRRAWPALAAGREPDPRPVSGFGNVLLVGAILLVIVVLVVMWSPWQSPKPQVHCPHLATTSPTQTPGHCDPRQGGEP